MTFEIALLLALIVASLVLFSLERIPPDVVAREEAERFRGDCPVLRWPANGRHFALRSVRCPRSAKRVAR